MGDSIWIVTNCAGGQANKHNAWCCQELVKQRVHDGVDILAEKRFKRAQKLDVGARIVMHQGGGKRWRSKGYPGAGMLVAAGTIGKVAQPLADKHKQEHKGSWDITVKCFQGKHLQGQLGIIFYKLRWAEQMLVTEGILGRTVWQGANYIEVKQTDPNYGRLDRWWRDSAGSVGVRSAT